MVSMVFSFSPIIPFIGSLFHWFSSLMLRFLLSSRFCGSNDAILCSLDWLVDSSLESGVGHTNGIFVVMSLKFIKFSITYIWFKRIAN